VSDVDAEELKRVLAEADCLHDEAAVQAAIGRLAESINAQFRDRHPLLLVVMTGGLVPAGWLLPKLDFLFEIDYVHATRYRGALVGDELEWIARPRKPLVGRDVLLIDDILDEGITLRELVAYCRSQGAYSVSSAVLARKEIGRAPAIAADHVGLTVEDRYVFGCGLDYKEHFRQLPALYALGNRK